jgi:hypothetical protein
LLSSASVSEVMNYYKNQFLAQGWELKKNPPSPYHPENLDQAVFTDGADERWIYSGRLDNNDQTFIFLLYNDKY